MLGVRDAKLLFVEDRMAFSRFAKMTICIVRDPPTVRALELVRQHTRRLRAVEPDGWIGFTAVETTAIVNLSDEVRQATAALLRDVPAALGVTVIEGGGFKGVAARAILQGIHMFSRVRQSERVFGDVPAAVDWTIANAARYGAPQGNVTADELRRAVEATRARL
jgi:hypothetical protein